MKLIAPTAYTENHHWMRHDGQRAVVIDPGEPAPVIEALDAQRPVLVSILVTRALRPWKHPF